jgi:hypothetical protein
MKISRVLLVVGTGRYYINKVVLTRVSLISILGLQRQEQLAHAFIQASDVQVYTIPYNRQLDQYTPTTHQRENILLCFSYRLCMYT